MRRGGQSGNPRRLTAVSDRGRRAPPTRRQFEG
ncbi:hypothetical protein CRN15_13975 [Raoultella planticola]|nr:hypothetical protein CRT62_20875 [Raoultella planticola]ATM15876.1 hypothetical protein CRN15_13975 [Raoultella planticola]PHH24181.1 hypothetical protein CRX55_08975 [Raoultella planticola]PIM82675.1 hypothetical protein CT151_20210 [Raoultella planticola]